MSFSRDELRAAYEEACRREIEALKPGNVHVFADGHRMSADQFLTSAEVSSGPLTDPGLPVGRRILEAVRATRKAVDTNTNLGIVLLCAPLARAAEMASGELRRNLGKVLDALDMDDAAAVFEAIVLASPGGLGSADAHDVRETPKVGLVEAMREASGRDRIAHQYVSLYDDVFGIGLPAIEAARPWRKRHMADGLRLYGLLCPLSGQPCCAQARPGNRRACDKRPLSINASLDTSATRWPASPCSSILTGALRRAASTPELPPI